MYFKRDPNVLCWLTADFWRLGGAVDAAAGGGRLDMLRLWTLIGVVLRGWVRVQYLYVCAGVLFICY